MSDNNIKAVIGSGYETPTDCHFINNYINEFGEPFSYFIYKLSKNVDFFINTMKKRYPDNFENDQFIVFNMSKFKKHPIIELIAGGSMFDAMFFKKEFPYITTKPQLLPHLFYLLISTDSCITIIKNDSLLHYSADTISKYLKKINWRIKNNVYFISKEGMAGFTGRNKWQTLVSRYKKYLFIPYAFSLIFPFYDAFLLVISRRKISYLIHTPLCVYTASLILYYYCLKIFGIIPKLKNYDESKEII